MTETKNMTLPNLKDYYEPSLPDSAFVSVPNGMLNELISGEAAEGATEYETGDEIVFLDSNGDQHKIVYDLAEDQPGLGSGWFIHPDDSFEAAPSTPAPGTTREASQAMLTAGARSIGNTAHESNHVQRAKACWQAMIDAVSGIKEPKPK